MGFLGKIFRWARRGKLQENPESEWEKIVYSRENVDFDDEEQRKHYISGCLDQMAEAAKESNLLAGEYSLVTAYLTDMEEIEALPEEERESINGIAGRLVVTDREREHYREKKNRMTDSAYYRMRQQETEIQEGIKKLSECEKYGELIRQDMQKLDRERHAYEFRRSELEMLMENFRGMAMIFMTAFAVCLVLLAILQFGFGMNTRAGYLLAVGAVILAVVVLVVKYSDSDRELGRVEGAIRRLIQLENTVKIRYVNNRNLSGYLCMKYNVDDSAALEKRWDQYCQEKEERKQYAEAEAKAEYYRKELVSKMSNYHITDPERWAGQAAALLDKREMVEIRHELILRRQALRKQMDYNNEVAQTAQNEIKDIAATYPAYAREILDMVDRYDSSIDLY